MVSAEKSNHLIITVNNKVGTLAEIAGVISSSGINLIAVCAYAVDNTGFIMFASEDNKKAKELLEQRGYPLLQHPCLESTQICSFGICLSYFAPRRHRHLPIKSR